MNQSWVGMKVKHLYINGCNTEKQINDILEKQADHPHFKIYDIQMIKDQGSNFAWIFYHGDFPDKREGTST